jgi:hypothetical protein
MNNTLRSANEADVVKYTEAVEVVKLKLDKLQDDVAACEVSLIPTATTATASTTVCILV